MNVRILSVIFSLLVYAAPAQQIKFKTYTVENGLSNNSINGIANDLNGGLWIATWDGLNFFDGRQFQVFRHDPENPKSLPGNHILNVLVDNEGTLWVQSSISTVSKQISAGTFENYTFPEDIVSLRLDVNGIVVAEGMSSRLRYMGEGFEACTTYNVAQHLDESQLQLILDHFPELQIKDVYSDREGNLWYATITTGLFVLPASAKEVSKAAFQNYTVEHSDSYGLQSNEVYSIHEDLFGNVWLGLKDGGLSMAYKRAQNIHYISPYSKAFPELPMETIRAISEDSEGNLLLGFYNSGVYRHDPKKGRYTPLFTSVPFPRSDWQRVRSLFTDSQGSVWVGTYAGLMRKAKDGKDHFFAGGSTANLKTGRNYDIQEDLANNCLWIACWGGISKFDLATHQFEPFEGMELLSPYKVRSVALDGNNLWLGTENDGVLRFDGTKIERFTYEDGLLDNSVYTILREEKTGYLWIGTLGGISIFHPSEGLVAQITEHEGLLSQLVYGILEGDDHMWASTTKGIAAIDRRDFSVTALPPNEGWQAGEFSEGAFYQSAEGTMYFAGVKGLNYFHPSSICLEFDLPKIQLRRIDASNQKRYPTGIQAKLQPVRFTETAYPDYMYKLLPVDGEWKVLDENLEIAYDNLAPGTYRLLAKSAADKEDQQVVSMDFIIPMPLWRAPWFIILSLSMVFAIFFVWRQQHNSRQRRHLESLIEERTRTIEKQKFELVKINQHLDQKNREINRQKEQLFNLHQQQKNPDVEIEKFKEFVLAQFRPPLIRIQQLTLETEDHSDKACAQINEQVVKLIRELSDWEKLSILDHLENSSASMTILPRLFDNLMNELDSQLRRRGITLLRSLDMQESWVRIDVLRLKLFFHCLYREMVKFMESGSVIDLRLTDQSNRVQIQAELTSEILKLNITRVMEGSPYLRSAERILAHLGGKLDYRVIESVSMSVEIPYAVSEHPHPISSWETPLALDTLIVPGVFNVLVLGNAYETDGLVKMVSHEQLNLIEEEMPENAKVFVERGAVDAVLIYNKKIDQDLLDFMEEIGKNKKSAIPLPVLYFFESMEYGLQEQLIDLGVGTCIQLPASMELVNKKLQGMLNKRKAYLEEKKQNSLVNLIENEESDRLTPNQKLLHQALIIIKEKYVNPTFRVEALSQELGISKMKCYRLFKEELDATPSDVITKFRLQKAEVLLQKKQMNVSEIGFECGFNDPKYFSKLFKRHYGLSPRSFN